STHPPTTDIHTLSLHDALPIFVACSREPSPAGPLDIRLQISHAAHGFSISLERGVGEQMHHFDVDELDRTVGARASTDRAIELVDRKSTRLNSSHSQISYAVFC